MQFKFISTFIITLLLYHSSIFANAAKEKKVTNLKSAIITSYNYNEEFRIANYQFLSQAEAFPQALSRFMPKLTLLLTRRHEKRHYPNLMPNSHTRDTILTARINQSLFHFGSDLASLNSASYAVKFAIAQYNEAQQKIIFNEIKVYLDLAASQRKHKLAKESLYRNTKQYEAANQRYELGEINRTSLANAKSNLEQSKANLAIAYSNLQSAESAFEKMFGRSYSNNLIIPKIAQNLPATENEFLKITFADNHQIKSLRYNLKSKKSSATSAKTSILPHIYASASISKNQQDYLKRDAQSIKYDGINADINLELPIFTQGGAEYSQIRKAKYASRIAALQLASEEKSILSRAHAVWDGFESRKIAVNAVNAEMHAAQIAYDGTLEEQSLGGKALLDVLDAEEKLSAARIRYIDVLQQFIIASYEMKLLMGKLDIISLGLLPVNIKELDILNAEKSYKKIKYKMIGF